MQVEQIKIEDIVVKEGFNVRDELGNLSDLVDSLKETNGVLNPILVNKIPDSSKYELLGGERRLEAAKKAKFKTIDCRIFEAKDDYEKFQIMFHENIGRKELTWIERAKATKLLFDISKRYNKHVEAAEQVAEKQNHSARTIFRYISAAKAIEDFPVLQREETITNALNKYKKIKQLDIRTQEKLKNNEISIKQAICVEKKHSIQRDVDTSNLVIEELKKEAEYYKNNMFELIKRKDKDERLQQGIFFFDELKSIVNAARSCEAFGLKDIQKEACEKCKAELPQVNQICDWWFESSK